MRAGRFKKVFGVSYTDPDAAARVGQKIENLRTLADGAPTELSTRVIADLIGAQRTATRFGFSTEEIEETV